VVARAYREWPPIIVRRCDYTVIDGWYRVLAARQLKQTHIDAVFFDGSPEAAYFEALRCNLQHGLPLSLQERLQAGRRVLALNFDWSDRRVAEVCGLAPGTVGRLRVSVNVRASVGRSTVENGQLNGRRRGLDGRLRPVDPDASKRRIIEALQDQPDQSLREIARITGASPVTVRSVRLQMMQGSLDAGGDQRESASDSRPGAGSLERGSVKSVASAAFARWFKRTGISSEWHDYIETIPTSKLAEVSAEARQRAQEWQEFASALGERISTSDGAQT